MNQKVAEIADRLALDVSHMAGQVHMHGLLRERIHALCGAVIAEVREALGYPAIDASLARGVFEEFSLSFAAEEKAHGWPDRTFGEDIALFHSELSEALEEYRNGHGLTETYYNPEKPDKPEGIPTELADCVIRIMAFCGKHGIDLGEAIKVKCAYNRTREIRHGGKRI